MIRWQRGWAACALGLAGSGPMVASAQGVETKVAAEALYDQARKLVSEGEFTAGCAKFEQSQRLDPGIGTLLYLADCYEKAGRIASAWATFREGASQAKAAGQTDRAASGESRAAALERRLSRLELRVAPENVDREGFVIRRGGIAVPKSVWGVSVPVDGGEWLIEASAPGARAWSMKIVVAVEHDAATLVIPALEAEPSAPLAPSVEAQPPAPAVAPAPAPRRDAAPAGQTQRAVGLVVGGVGIIGVGLGGYFGLRAFGKNSDAKEICGGAVCRDRRGVTLTDEARDAAVLSNVLFGAGLAAVAGGAVVYLTAPTRETSALLLAPRVAKSSGGVWLGGRF